MCVRINFSGMNKQNYVIFREINVQLEINKISQSSGFLHFSFYFNYIYLLFVFCLFLEYLYKLINFIEHFSHILSYILVFVSLFLSLFCLVKSLLYTYNLSFTFRS